MIVFKGRKVNKSHVWIIPYNTKLKITLTSFSLHFTKTFVAFHFNGYYMRSLLTISPFILLLFFPACTRETNSFLQTRNQDKIIAIQPLENYDTTYLQFISTEISNFYNRKVIILMPADIPPSFRLSENYNFYSADSILNWLQGFVKEEIIEVIGLTHEKIGIVKKEKNAAGNTLTIVLGLGDFPGHCCVVSDHNFEIGDTVFYKNRLRKAVLHEVGHNLGLDHCSSDLCIMAEKYKSVTGFLKSADDYCEACKKNLCSRSHAK